MVLGGGVEPVFVDFIKDGQTLLTESVEMSGGRGEYQFDLPPDVCGTIELLAYRFGDAGLPVRKSGVIYVHPAGQLALTAALDASEYRPGGQAKLTLQITNEQGQPTPGAVSLAAVDEAVFSVLEQAPGTERTFFNLEQELLQPIYAIYDWSPNLERSDAPEERNRFESALFARTWREVGGRRAVFQRLLDEGLVTERQLEVLDSPDLDDLIASGGRGALPDQLVELIQQTGGPHTLAVKSFPVKVREVEVRRRQGMALMRAVWVVLALAFVVGGLIVLIVLVRGIWAPLALGIVCLALLVSILMPSLSRAREISKRAVAASDLRGIGQGMLVWSREEDEGQKRGILTSSEAAGRQPIRVREWFPETLLWRPELITDDQGRVSLDVELADSITTWRLTASAVSADGRLGGIEEPIRVFQPFFVDLNLPVALTRGDEVAVPVVVYNYLAEPQTVELTLDTATGGWLELLDEPVQRLDLDPGEVRATAYRLRAARVGQHTLQITARGTGVGDAIKREIEVVPDGRRVAEVRNGTLQQPIEFTFDVPADAIEGSVKAILKIYPSTFSQVLEGLEGIFQRPYGCFEQTSSTTYPNVLALDYLRRANKSL
ncbi:MAG TPA: alpha-2-macroglobulin family protein, partial [Phycisphaerae bacterium]|nr:alpha-2-macroglobulin family protein [Phycisphaerae bacterium]